MPDSEEGNLWAKSGRDSRTMVMMMMKTKLKINSKNKPFEINIQIYRKPMIVIMRILS